MEATLLLMQAMLPRKSGVAPAMVPLKMVPPIMGLKIAQTCLRQSLQRRFKVIRITINHPNKCIFAGVATPEMLLKTCDPHGKLVAIGMI
jgi:hypothetical protein